jgi:hypothetical protein
MTPQLEAVIGAEVKGLRFALCECRREKPASFIALPTVDGGGDVRELKLIEGYALSAELVNLISWPSFAELSFPGCDPRDDEIDADANSMTRNGRGCVKTCMNQGCAELFFQFSAPERDCQYN